jgi:hypothetical protein
LGEYHWRAEYARQLRRKAQRRSDKIDWFCFAVAESPAVWSCCRKLCDASAASWSVRSGRFAFGSFPLCAAALKDTVSMDAGCVAAGEVPLPGCDPTRDAFPTLSFPTVGCRMELMLMSVICRPLSRWRALSRCNHASLQGRLSSLSIIANSLKTNLKMSDSGAEKQTPAG